MTEPSSTPGGPAPAQLPGIEGFYLLTADGELGRYKADGRFVAEPDLSRSLADKTEDLLRRYRALADDAVIALVVPSRPDDLWRSATVVLSNDALRRFLRTSHDPDAPLTAFEKRNRTKSIFQGMEVLLAANDAMSPTRPFCCPVLFVPEVDGAVLCRRYGVDSADPAKVLEVLDLAAPLSPDEKRHPYLLKMVMDMQRTRIAPEMRSGPELALAADARAAEPQPNESFSWSNVGERRQEASSLEAGDPVAYWLLGWFAPFNELNDLQRQFIARGHKITKVEAGTTLIHRGSLDDLSVCLIEGTVELEAFDGKKIQIVGGTRRASLPISQLRPHAYTVKAATDVKVILVSQKMIREVTRITTTYKNRPGIEVAEMASLPGDIPG